MNTIDWSRGIVYLYADRTGIIETSKDNLEYIIHFNWYVDSCPDDYFYISTEFEPITVHDTNTGDYIEVPYEPYEETLHEMVEREVNNDPESLGLDNYHEDRYNFD